MATDLQIMRNTIASLRRDLEKQRKKLRVRDVQLQYASHVLKTAQAQGFVVKVPLGAEEEVLGRVADGVWVAGAVDKKVKDRRKARRQRGRKPEDDSEDGDDDDDEDDEDEEEEEEDDVKTDGEGKPSNNNEADKKQVAKVMTFRNVVYGAATWPVHVFESTTSSSSVHTSPIPTPSNDSSAALPFPPTATLANAPISPAFPQIAEDANAKAVAIKNGTSVKKTRPPSETKGRTSEKIDAATIIDADYAKRATWRGELIAYFAGFSLDNSTMKKLQQMAAGHNTLQTFLSVRIFFPVLSPLSSSTSTLPPIPLSTLTA